jgi:hypothetical protein
MRLKIYSPPSITLYAVHSYSPHPPAHPALTVHEKRKKTSNTPGDGNEYFVRCSRVHTSTLRALNLASTVRTSVPTAPTKVYLIPVPILQGELRGPPSPHKPTAGICVGGLKECVVCVVVRTDSVDGTRVYGAGLV